MSTFESQDLPCPRCGFARRVELALGLNVRRSPEAAAELRAGTFQVYTCGLCGVSFRVESRMVVVDLVAGWVIYAFEPDDEAGWARFEVLARASFEETFGPAVAAVAQEIGRRSRLRAVFGLDALREKVLCLEAGLDDAALEVLKLRVLAATPGLATSLAGRPRLTAITADTLQFSVLVHRGGTARPSELSLPRGLLDEALDLPPYRALAERLAQGLYVDLGRLLGPPPELQEAEDGLPE